MKKKKNRASTIRNIVEENLKRMERVELSDIVEIIRPLYTFTAAELIEKELKSKARCIMRNIRDDEGVRTFFSDSSGVYVNVDKNEDLVDLSRVNKQLSIKYSGMTASIDKVRTRIHKVVQKFKHG